MEETYHRLGLKVRCKPMYEPSLCLSISNKRRLGFVTNALDTEVENPHRHDRSIKTFIMLLSKWKESKPHPRRVCRWREHCQCEDELPNYKEKAKDWERAQEKN